MRGNSFGILFRITTFGESHGPALGVVVDGCPAGLPLAVEEIQTDLDRRRPGRVPLLETARQEEDRAEINSGIFQGKTTGAPIEIEVRNTDVKSGPYEQRKGKFRPSHADWTVLLKEGYYDYRGGARLSNRETIGRVAAGAIARKILALAGVRIFAYVRSVGDITIDPDRVDYASIEKNYHDPKIGIRCPDAEAARAMRELVLKVRGRDSDERGDSIGAVVECIAQGVPVGLGEPVFDKLDARLAYAMMGLPAAKGVEIGSGFELARMRGSEGSDELFLENGRIVVRPNHSGGTHGGISSGADLVVRVAFKPTSSIRIPKKSVGLDWQRYEQTGELEWDETEVEMPGRHDPCVGLRAGPNLEAMMALVLCDFWLIQQQTESWKMRMKEIWKGRAED